MRGGHEHLTLQTKNFNRALGFWQALGFELQQTRGEDGKRVCQLFSADIDVAVEKDDAEGGVRYHLKAKDVDSVVRQLQEKRRDVRISQHLSEPGWSKSWMRVTDPDGNIYVLEQA